MRFSLLLLLCLLMPAVVLAEPSPAQTELEAIITQQQKLLSRAARDKAGPDFDADQFQVDVQDLCYKYDDYLKRHPDIAAGYVAYGLMLAKIDMRKESMAILLKANKLDPNIPQVKNQLGNFLAEDGKPLEAVSYFLAAIKLDPNEPLYHYQLGTLLHEARDDFLSSGEWTRDALDYSMHKAFKRAAELAPDRIEFTYRYAESFYDLDTPQWNEALKVWDQLEKQEKPGVARETIRLHKANIYIKMNNFKEAETLLATVKDPVLAKQKEKLVAELRETRKK